MPAITFRRAASLALAELRPSPLLDELIAVVLDLVLGGFFNAATYCEACWLHCVICDRQFVNFFCRRDIRGASSSSSVHARRTAAATSSLRRDVRWTKPQVVANCPVTIEIMAAADLAIICSAERSGDERDSEIVATQGCSRHVVQFSAMNPKSSRTVCANRGTRSGDGSDV